VRQGPGLGEGGGIRHTAVGLNFIAHLPRLPGFIRAQLTRRGLDGERGRRRPGRSAPASPISRPGGTACLWQRPARRLCPKRRFSEARGDVLIQVPERDRRTKTRRPP